MASTRLVRAVVVTGVLAGAFAPPAAAQTLTAALTGVVSDASGLRLPGVTVTAASVQLIAGQEVRTTGDQGTYRFPTLPPGTYTVTFELSGFQTVRRESLALLAGQSLSLDAQLGPAAVAEQLTVIAQAPLIDTRSAAVVNIADQATLQNVPVARNFTDILNTMPGVTDGLYDFSRVNTVHGSTVRQNVYTLDGVNLDDPNTNTPVTDLAPDAFQEVQVTTAGIAAEFGDASGGVFNYITKSGGNKFSGGANTYVQTRRFESSNVSAALQRQDVQRGGFEHVYDAGVLVGGPVLRNRAWFFANYRQLDQAERRSDFAGEIGNDDRQWFSKGTVQLAAAHRVEGSYYFRDFLNFPFANIATFRTSGDPRTWFGVAKQNHVGMGRWTATMGSHTVIEARGSVSFLDQVGQTPNNVGAPVYIDQSTGIVTGGDDQSNANVNARDRHQIKADLSRHHEGWAGNHTFKTGVDWQTMPTTEIRFLSGARGANELVGCANGQGCISLTPDTHHLLFDGAPFRVRLYNTPRTQLYRTRHLSAYAQDQWVATRHVTLSLGVRADRFMSRILPSSGGGGRWEAAVTTFAAQDAIDLTTVAPRLGVVWDLAGNHQSTVKASYGRFYYQISNAYMMPVSPAGIGYRELDWVDVNNDLIYQPGEERTLRADTRPNPARLPTIDPDLKNQYTDVVTVGFERSFRSAWTVAATVIVKQEGDLFATTNAAVPFSAYNTITVQNSITGAPMTIHTLRLEFQGRPGQIIITNPGTRPGDPVELERKYRGLEIVARKRMDRRWQAEASYVWGRGRGNVGNAFQDSTLGDYTNPNVLINRFGDLPLGPRHQMKLHGVYLAPFDILLSGYFQALSGTPWTDTLAGSNLVKGAATVRLFRTAYPQIQSETFIDVAGEAAGTRTFERQTRLDVRVEKRLRLRPGMLSIAADVFNVFNRGAVIRVRELRFDNVNFGVPAQLQMPRQVRFAVKWSF